VIDDVEDAGQEQSSRWYTLDMPDAVDGILEQWARERPDLDASPMAVMGRIKQLAREIERALDRVFARFDLGLGEFDVLATLRRSGAPYRLTPGALLEATMVTSGAITKRVDRLEQAGLVTRAPDPNDRRGVLVGLTGEGLELVDRVVEEHVANEENLLAGLTGGERERLARLLRKLGESVRAAEGAQPRSRRRAA
jgi:DNA-binding MarR family transcriptional regulator